MVFPVSVALGQAPVCSDASPPTATLGIGRFQCVTETECSVNLRTGPGRFAHQFSTEPTVWSLEPGSPAGSSLRDGDAIVAIDGTLITTAEGGRRLAALQAGEPVLLRIRRNGVERDVRLTPVTGCGRPHLTVMTPTEQRRYGDGPSAAARFREELARLGAVAGSAAPEIDFGLELSCGQCGWVRREGQLRFETESPPAVLTLVPGGPGAEAGLLVGDRLVAIDDLPITSPEAAVRLGAARPGEALRITVERGGVRQIRTLRPRQAARHPF